MLQHPYSFFRDTSALCVHHRCQLDPSFKVKQMAQFSFVPALRVMIVHGGCIDLSPYAA